MGTDGSNGHKDETIIIVIKRMITAVILITIILMMIMIMVLITGMALAMIIIIRNHINRNETLEAILNITSDSKCTWTSKGRAPCSC